MFVISKVGRNIRWPVLLFSALVQLFTVLSTAKNSKETAKCKWRWTITLKLNANLNGDICLFVNEVLEVLCLEKEVGKHSVSHIKNFLKINVTALWPTIYSINIRHNMFIEVTLLFPQGQLNTQHGHQHGHSNIILISLLAMAISKLHETTLLHLSL